MTTNKIELIDHVINYMTYVSICVIIYKAWLFKGLPGVLTFIAMLCLTFWVMQDIEYDVNQ